MRILHKIMKYWVTIPALFLIGSFLVKKISLNAEYDSSQQSENKEEIKKDSKEEKDDSKEESAQHAIYSFLSDYVRYIYDSIDNKKISDINNKFDSAYNRLNEKYIDSEKLTDIADMVVLSLFLNNGMISKDVESVNDNMTKYIEKYSSDTKAKYDEDKYNSMVQKSEEFGSSGKNTSSSLPEKVTSFVFENILNNYPIKYENNILISLNDAQNLSNIKCDVEYMKNNATIEIKYNDNFIEIEGGSNQSLLNDSRFMMNNPVLNVKGVTYVPIDFLNLLGCETIEYDGAAIIY